MLQLCLIQGKYADKMNYEIYVGATAFICEVNEATVEVTTLISPEAHLNGHSFDIHKEDCLLVPDKEKDKKESKKYTYHCLVHKEKNIIYLTKIEPFFSYILESLGDKRNDYDYFKTNPLSFSEKENFIRKIKKVHTDVEFLSNTEYQPFASLRYAYNSNIKNSKK